MVDAADGAKIRIAPQLDRVGLDAAATNALGNEQAADKSHRVGYDDVRKRS